MARSLVGQTLSHYKIIDKLRSGGMGEVYVAEDIELDRKVALKVLPPDLAESEERRARFKREAKAVASLNHPNIVTVFSVEEVDGVHFITMELVKGKTLTETILAKGMPLSRFFEVAIAAADAVAAAHQEGVTHRDLKPDNVMVSDEGRVKILDFGLAKLRPVVATEGMSELPTGSMTREGVIVGTVSHMSPEQAEGKRVDHRTDIFSLGIVLYEMATGERPFTGDTPVSVLGSILKETPRSVAELNGAISRELADAIHRCLAKDPDDRFQTAAELKTALEELKRNTKSGRKDWSIRTAVPIAAVVLVLVGILGALLMRGGGGNDTSPPSLAVLPFENLSADPDDDYFSDGMTGELINKLFRIQNLDVASRTSVARFKETERDIKDVARELGVRYVLEGSVRKAGDRVRINVQLIDASSGFQLWADPYEGELKDVFAVQEETALKITEALDLQLTPQQQQSVQLRYTDSPEAYDAYLRGIALVDRFDRPEALAKARGHFEAAVNADSEFAPALAGLADVEVALFSNTDRSDARLARAIELAQRALARAPDLSIGHMALGSVFFLQGDSSASAKELREAVRLDPDNVIAWTRLAWVLHLSGRPAEAEASAREAVRLQPSRAESHFQLGESLHKLGRFEEAIAELEYSLELDPAFVIPRVILSRVHVLRGNPERALPIMEEVERRDHDSPMFRRSLAYTYAALGDLDRAFFELEEGFKKGYFSRHYFETVIPAAYPDDLTLRATMVADPRWGELLERYEQN